MTPNRKQIRWTASAANDLEEIALYIGEDNERAAQAVATSIFDTANSLINFPFRGRVGRIDGTRELLLSALPYVIAYKVGEEVVEVLHVFHGARNWPPRQ